MSLDDGARAEPIGPILVIDDDRDVVHAARLALKTETSRIETATSLDSLEDLLGRERFEVVLLDMNFALGDQSGREGLDGLARVQACDPTLSVVLMTAYGAVSLAVEALKRGGADFVLKPWRNDKLVEAVRAAALRARAARRDQAAFDLDDVERVAIQRALDHHGGNISHAATALGLTRAALYRRIAKHGL